MIKKCKTIVVVICVAASCFAAAWASGSANVNTTVVVKQLKNNNLAKQTNIIPKKQSNWSKIKDLFM